MLPCTERMECNIICKQYTIPFTGSQCELWETVLEQATETEIQIHFSRKKKKSSTTINKLNNFNCKAFCFSSRTRIGYQSRCLQHQNKDKDRSRSRWQFNSHWDIGKQYEPCEKDILFLLSVFVFPRMTLEWHFSCT